MTSAGLDEATFASLTERYRRELHLHCYRMLASFDEAEDAVQEVLLRAWRRYGDLAPDSNVRAWLYRIATNGCLDVIRARRRRLTHLGSLAEVPWLQPYPDRLLDEVPAADDGPEVLAVARETVELAFIAALQVLPARQRAALLLRDVLGLTAAETAAHLGTSVPAANSALQRARRTLQQHLPARAEWSAPAAPTARERALLSSFIDAHERCDAEAAMALAAPDLRATMPPAPMVFDGVAAFAPLLERAFGPDRDGDWRLVPTAANRMPAAASYLRRPGDTVFRGFKLDVLRISGDVIAEITTFGWSRFEGLGLPLELVDGALPADVNRGVRRGG